LDLGAKGNGNIPLHPNGTFAYNMPMDESIPILPVRFYGYSASSAGDFPKLPTTYFVKKGTQYVAATPNKQSAEMGDTVTYTLTMHNAEKLKEQTFTFDYLKDYFDIESIKVNPELQKQGTVSLTDEELQGNSTLNKHSIHVSITGADQGIDGNIPAVDVTMKVKDNRYYEEELDLKNLTSTYINVDQATVSVPGLSVESYVIPTFSEAYFDYFQAEGLSNTDYTKIGASLTVKDQNNKRYEGTINSVGGANVTKLPVSTEEFSYRKSVPGHFVDIGTFTVIKQDGKSIRGERDSLSTRLLIAGDVNGDNVIDIMDALAIQTYWETNKRSADINFDGTVDAKDFVFVEKNFGKQNRAVPNAPKPQKKYKGKALADIKRELGIQ
jgi:Dockerin type I domain